MPSTVPDTEAPLLDEKSRDHDDQERASLLKASVAAVVPLAIGFSIAEGIYHWTGMAAYESKAHGLGELGYVYLSAVVLAVLTRFLNFLPTTLKNSAMKTKAKGNIRANMYLYKVADDSNGSKGSMVILDEDAAAGRYNRANRSLHHFVENALPVFLCVPLAGYCFPLPTFVLTVVFSIGRILHQVAYSNSGYGAHALGFIIALLSAVVLEGLVLVAGLRAAGASL